MPSDAQLRQILQEARVIAMVGASMNPDRPSHHVMQFLLSKGKWVIPVNPGHAGKELLGQRVYASLADIPASAAVDMVDVFRKSDAVEAVVTEAVAHLPHLRTVWLQLGVHSDKGAELARGANATMVQNRCPAIEWPRLGL